MEVLEKTKHREGGGFNVNRLCRKYPYTLERQKLLMKNSHRKLKLKTYLKQLITQPLPAYSY